MATHRAVPPAADASPPGPGTAADTAKRALRARIRADRRQRSDAQRQADAERIAQVLMELPEIRATRCVTAYASTPTEPGTGPLRAALRAAGYRTLLPIVLPEGVLDWAEDSGELRQPNGLGGPEPDGPRLGPDGLRSAEALIIPALAVDTLGGRIGYGGGYYDRALRRAAVTVPVIAVVHDREVLDAAVEPLPVQPHDVRVGAVVTPHGCLRLPPRA